MRNPRVQLTLQVKNTAGITSVACYANTSYLQLQGKLVVTWRGFESFHIFCSASHASPDTI